MNNACTINIGKQQLKVHPRHLGFKFRKVWDGKRYQPVITERYHTSNGVGWVERKPNGFALFGSSINHAMSVCAALNERAQRRIAFMQHVEDNR